MSHDALLTEFARHRPTLTAVSRDVEARLTQLLTEHAVMVHFVAGRVKSEASLRRKLARPEKTYRQLWDVTDLVGLRIATYFEDTIEDVARLIEKTFAVDFRHSTDKLRFTDSSSFGYRSLHYVCALGSAHALDSAFRFEIQVRTALQHAWAEVEHDLGYKADTVPAQIRRRFSRVASLLEIADQEFVSIRRELNRYQATVQNEVAQADVSVPLDEVSLAALVRTPEFVALDEAVSTQLQCGRGSTLYFPEYLLKLLRLAGLTTTRELREALARHGSHVASIVGPYFEFSERTWHFGPGQITAVEQGYGLFFLAHLAILRGPELILNRVARLTSLYQQLDELDEPAAHEIATGLLKALIAG